MIRAETYDWIANEFGTSVGIAEWDGPVANEIPNAVSQMSDDLKYVVLTRFIIYHEIYQQVQRELYRLERKYKNYKRIKPLTLLTKAIDIVAEREGISLID